MPTPKIKDGKVVMSLTKAEQTALAKVVGVLSILGAVDKYREKSKAAMDALLDAAAQTEDAREAMAKLFGQERVDADDADELLTKTQSRLNECSTMTAVEAVVTGFQIENKGPSEVVTKLADEARARIKASRGSVAAQ